MALTGAEEIERRILAQASDGPVWNNTLKHVHHQVRRLCQGGHLARCAPSGGKGANMVKITDKGRARLAELRKRR